MRITWKELMIGFDENQSNALLEDWRWLTGDDLQPIAVSALGDLFLDDADGHIFRLETGAARLSQIAESIDEFNQLRQQKEHATEWFAPNLIGDLIESGKSLGPGQCYSYKSPPMLNGAVEVDNIEPADLLVHCSIFGQIGRQIQKLPEGTKINKITVTEESD